MSFARIRWGLAASTAALAAAAWSAGLADGPLPAPRAAAEAAATSGPADRKAYFGELHLHTTMSFDAWTFGTKVTPDMAYKFARGDTVMVQAAQVARQQEIAVSGPVPATRAWPLDFAAVTDHSEYLGAVAQLDVPGSAFSQTAIGKSLAAGGRGAFFRAAEAIRGVKNDTTEAMAAAARAADGWDVEMAATRANYRPGKFTTLLAYEWTSSPGQGIHMHRNVIFNRDRAPPPFTSVDSNRPADLWKFMAGVRRDGLDVLAIPHNSNLSDGREFDWNDWDGKPIDAAYALAQSLNEPLVEMAQTKGASETTPEISPSDEFANFEIMDRLYRGETAPKSHGSYVREGLGRGLVIAAKVGANPFKMGFVGASDIHNGLSASDEAAMISSSQAIDPKTMFPSQARARAALGMVGERGQLRPNGQVENDPLQSSSAAITGVWAEENTRPAIFAALKRKETFATSGTRIRVRMFAGWGFSPASLKGRDWVARAYAQGVPMGGDLPARGAASGSPKLIVQAAKDPSGANLDRIQVVKLWLAGDGYRERVFDVALSGARRADPASGKAPAVGNTVDLATGAYRNSIGAATLTAVWSDPQFDPKAPALYYVRVLEIPTPRWSTLLAIRSRLPVPKGVPATIQERAWSSPVWYSPG